MKIVCIYHSIDLDGWMSAAIVKHWFNQQEVPYKLNNGISDTEYGVNSIEFMGYNYGQPIPDLSEYDKVIMCDISFPKEEMAKLYLSRRNNKTGISNFIWIDHHLSAIKDNTEVNEMRVIYDGLCDVNFAACELTWVYFMCDGKFDKPIPEIVRLLGLYDSFRYKGTNEEQKVLEFQYGARQIISNYEEAYKYLLMEINKEFRDDLKIKYKIHNDYITYMNDSIRMEQALHDFRDITNICPICSKHIKLPGNGIICKLCECNLK